MMNLTLRNKDAKTPGFWQRLKADQRGASTVEYVIVVGLVSLAAFTIFDTLGGTIAGKAGEVNTRVTQIHP